MDSTIDTKFSGPQFLPNGSKTNSEGYDKILIKYTHSLLVHSMNTTDVYQKRNLQKKTLETRSYFNIIKINAKITTRPYTGRSVVQFAQFHCFFICQKKLRCEVGGKTLTDTSITFDR